MKHLLNSVAIAAILAITVPALAQAQSPGPRPARPHASSSHRHAGHLSRTHHRGYVRTARSTTRVRTEGAGASPTDNVANQLNGQELQRLDASAAPMGMGAPMAPSFQPGPRASGGGAFPAGAAGPVSMAPGTAEQGPKTSGGGNIPAPTGPLPMPPPPPISSPVR